MKKLFLVILILISLCTNSFCKEFHPIDVSEVFCNTANPYQTIVWLLKVHDRYYLVNSNGGIVEHKLPDL